MQKKITTLSALVIFVVAWFSPCAFGQTYEIKQDNYTFKMSVTQTVPTETFVINEGSKPDKETYSKNDKNRDNDLADTFNIKTVVHFQIDSSVLIPSEVEKILAVLSNKISKEEIKKTSLIVTGYTCSLGPDQYNKTLSLQRAKAVADFLRKHGFTVATVQGKGSQNPVTNDPRQFHLNRRVTVRVIKK